MILDLEQTAPPPSWGVSISNDAIDRYARLVADQRFPAPRFDYPGMPDWEGEHWARLALLGTSTMACLWPPHGQEMWSIDWRGQRLTDAPAIWSCFERAFPTGIDLESLATVEGPAFFAGGGHLQLVAERQETLRSVARYVLDRHGGQALALISAAQNDGPILVQLLSDEVPGFFDRFETEAGTLPFDKLAHLAVAVVAGRIAGIRRLEMFPVYPDYMLPMVLRHHGILVYERDLATMVDRRETISSGDPCELAIRWATVSAASALRRRLNELGNPVDTPSLDYFLWSSAVLGPAADAMGEHHRTVTMNY